MFSIILFRGYKKKQKKSFLVGGFNLFEKYERQNGNLPGVGMKLKKYLSCHHLGFIFNTAVFRYGGNPLSKKNCRGGVVRAPYGATKNPYP